MDIVVDDDRRAACLLAHGPAELVRIYGGFGHRLEPVAVAGPPDADRGGAATASNVADAGAEMILLNTVSLPARPNR